MDIVARLSRWDSLKTVQIRNPTDVCFAGDNARTQIKQTLLFWRVTPRYSVDPAVS